MKAVILEKINAPLIVDEVELTPLEVGQVLVKVLTSGLCGSQLLEIGGHKGNAKFVPHLMGHEGCGEVVEIGAGVTRMKPGDRVVMHWMKTEGIESNFPHYKYKDKLISSGKVTTLNEYSIVSENRLTVVPSDTPPELCSLLGCCLTTALGTITNEANIKMGESVMIIGCGGVGLNLIMGTKLHNAYPILAVDIFDNKKDLALEMGATKFVNARTEPMLTEKFDVIMDTTGNTDVIAITMEMLADSGRYILVGQSSPSDCLHVPNYCHLFGGTGKTIKASQGGRTNPATDIPRYIKLAKSGIINVNKMITNILPLEDINKAVELVKQGKSGRIIINIWK
jgi:S-(hydroxymethyl)glutathione dehydrogenase/alcohol dehydrogenase